MERVCPLPPGTRTRRAGEQEKRKREVASLGAGELERLIRTLEEEMHEAAVDLRFEYAARLRDEIGDLKRELRSAV